MWSDPEDKTATQEPRYRVSSFDRVEGLDCEQAELLISRHMDGELDPANTARLDEHLKNCATCQANLSSWTQQSNMITAELDSLWQKTQKTAARQTRRPSVSRFRRCMWVPLGMVASQVLALIGLTIYFLFFTSPVQAPRTSSPDLKIEKQPAMPAQVVASTVSERPAVAEEPPKQAPDLETPPPIPSMLIVIAPQVAPEKAYEVKLSTPERMMFASSMASEPLREIQNVSVQYSISANADGTAKDERGVIRILGDVFSDRCIVRIDSNRGERTDVAIRDIDTVLNPPQRLIVRHLIDTCSQPDMRKRFAVHSAKQ